MKLNFIWKEKTGEYQTGEELGLSRIAIAGYSWNANRSQGHTDDDDWIGMVYLPGVINKRFVASTQETIRAKLENIVTKWFSEVLK